MKKVGIIELYIFVGTFALLNDERRLYLKNMIDRKN